MKLNINYLFSIKKKSKKQVQSIISILCIGYALAISTQKSAICSIFLYLFFILQTASFKNYSKLGATVVI